MKRKIILISLWVFIFGIISTFFINYYMIKKTSNKIINLNDIATISDIDAILVLGCKVYSYGPSMMLEKRLDKGIEVYNLIGGKLLLSGDHGTKKYDEVNIMRDYAIKSGVNTQDIFLDHAGLSTYDSIYRLKYIFNAKKVIIVTQKYHMYRSLYLADSLGVEAYGVCADDLPYKDIMLKNQLREILSRDKNFIKALIKPQSKYLGDEISLKNDGNVTNG